MSYVSQHDKTNNVAVRPAKTQISLGVRPVWSESSLSAWRKLGFLATHWAYREDSDQTGGCRGWSESLLGTHSLCWFCHVVAHMSQDGDVKQQYCKSNMSHAMRKPAYAIHEQQRCRSACTSVESVVHSLDSIMPILAKPKIASFCGRVDQFEYMSQPPMTFFHDVAHIYFQWASVVNNVTQK